MEPILKHNVIEDSTVVYDYLDKLPIEYRKQYKGMYGRTMSVPRGQASFTINEDIHYNYKVSGGSPPNQVMCDTLQSITKRVNNKLGTNFNTILLNKYKNGEDHISFHMDKETGWVDNTGFATLSFGATRDFQIKSNETNEVNTIPHENNMLIYMPYPMNQQYKHSVPKRKRCKSCRISLTFRELK